MREPWQDADDYYLKAEQWAAMRPVCCMCSEHIQEERALHIEIPKQAVDLWICDSCNDYYQEFID